MKTSHGHKRKIRGTALRASKGFAARIAATGNGFELLIVELDALFFGDLQDFFLVFAGFDLGDLFNG